MASKDKKKKRDAERLTRQLKVDFESVEDLDDFKALAEELGVSYSQLARLFIEHGKYDYLEGKLNISDYLTEGKLHWLKAKDIDLDKYRKDRDGKHNEQ